MKLMYVVGILVKPGIFKRRFVRPLCATENEELAQQTVHMTNELIKPENNAFNWRISCYWRVPVITEEWKVKEPEE